MKDLVQRVQGKKTKDDEKWVTIKDFNKYEVSNMAGVRNAKTKKILKGRNWIGYPKVTLMKDNKKHERRVHRLVAEHFIPNPDGLPIVNHINSVRGDHTVKNLEWTDNSGNQLHRWATQKAGVKKQIYTQEYGKNSTRKNIVKQASDTYKLHIDGEKVQNVGLRKNLHRILDEHNMDGIAVNDPYNDTVQAYISGSSSSRKKATQQLGEYIQNKTGHPITIQEEPSQENLKRISLNKQQLRDVSNGQYLAYMLRSGDDKRNETGTGLKKAERDIIPRFRLKKTSNGTYEGKLPTMGIKQLTGKAPHYKKFMKENQVVSLEKALSNMKPSDRKSVKQTLNRMGTKFIDD